MAKRALCYPRTRSLLSTTRNHLSYQTSLFQFFYFLIFKESEPWLVDGSDINGGAKSPNNQPTLEIYVEEITSRKYLLLHTRGLSWKSEN